MTPSGTETSPKFSRPLRQVAGMLAVLALVAAGVSMAAPRVLPVFLANVYFNGFILFVFAVGVLACFWQTIQLYASVRWIERFAADRGAAADLRAPRLLSSLASLLREHDGRKRISSFSSRSILDSVAQRIDEAREITRYITNFLIFLGLLGTFYGLAITVPAVVETIRGLVPREGEGGVEVFRRLIGGLEAQLGGMGVAFSSSLLGLAGSLVVGLLELLSGHGQNRFYRELEEWMSTITVLGVAGGEEGGGDHALVAALLERSEEQMEAFREALAGAEAGRAAAEERFAALAASVAELVAALEKRGAGGDAAADRQSAELLRSIDVHMLRILEELSGGRAELAAQIRGDIAELVAAANRIREAAEKLDPPDAKPPGRGRKG